MQTSTFGKTYKDAEIIIKQGEPGDSLYMIQKGLVEIVKETNRGDVLLARRGKGEIFGEMAVFDHAARSATVRSVGESYVLTTDKKNLMRRIHEDPSVVFRLLQTISTYIRELNSQVADLKISTCK